MQQGYFIIGDVHGCLKTFQQMVEQFWDEENETLVQLGDLIDRGKSSVQTLLYCMALEKRYPEKTMFLKGNHEQMLLDYFADISTSWLANGGRVTLMEILAAKVDLEDLLAWIEKRKLYFETDHIFISHAGMSLKAGNSQDLRDPNGYLWNRGPLKNLGKTQIIGHTPLKDGKPSYSTESDSWNIDTGAYKGISLTGIKLDSYGNLIKYITIPTKEEDLDPGNI